MVPNLISFDLVNQFLNIMSKDLFQLLRPEYRKNIDIFSQIFDFFSNMTRFLYPLFFFYILSHGKLTIRYYIIKEVLFGIMKALWRFPPYSIRSNPKGVMLLFNLVSNQVGKNVYMVSLDSLSNMLINMSA